MLLTVVIPVYKVEKYLKRCVDSVINQMTENVEIIFVDDGSPDGSGKICDEYNNRYSNVSVIHKKNGGLSSARNAGIESAQGRYIMFIDSDDWIAEGCIEKFLSIIQNNDIDLIVGKARIIDGEGKEKDKMRYMLTEGLYSAEDYISSLNVEGCYSACAPFTICKRDFLYKNEIRFLEGVVQEDELWTPTILLKANEIYYSDIYFYYNYVREDSITHSTNRQLEGHDLLTVTLRVLELFKTLDINKAQVLTDKMVFNYLRAICMVDNIEEVQAIMTPKILRQYSLFRITKYKAFLYSISPKLYLVIHRIVKG